MKILAYTVAYGNRRNFEQAVPLLRAAAGVWFDWHLFLGAPSPRTQESAKALLNDPRQMGIQFLTLWPENRGQHHAFAEVLKQAQEQDYDWLLRLDDDITPKTKDFLKKMLARLTELKKLAEDEEFRLIASPKVVGLKHPLKPTGTISVGQSYTVDVMEKVGGACRLMPVALLKGIEIPLYDPVGRGDPETIMLHASKVTAMIVRFPDIRVVHQTDVLELKDTPEQAQMRRLSKAWPWLETADL